MHSRAPILAIVALLAGFTAACGPFHRQSDASTPVIVFVNESIDQAVVYAVAPGGVGRARIGTVLAGRTETLRIPRSVMSGGNSVDIVARTLASARVVRTGPITLSDGNRLQVTLPASENTLTVLPLAEQGR
jgi:hypothetical protein